MTDSGGDVADEQPTSIMEQVDAMMLKCRQQVVPVVILPLTAITVSLILTGNASLLFTWMILPLWNLALRIVGTMVGIGLGLGLAAHVHDRLEVWHAQHYEAAAAPAPGIPRTRSGTSVLRKQSSYHCEDETSYPALMAFAGYDVKDGHLRGQVIKRDVPFFFPNYPYTHVPEEQQRGVTVMAEQWPHFPKPISHQLGRWIEHIVRDYVACWYCMIDAGCPYQNEKEMRAAADAQQQEDNGPPNSSDGRTMILQTAPHRPLPMMDCMYRSLAIVFGNLSSRVEHVNVFSLVLLKFTKVLGLQLKTYRQLRTLALQKAFPHSAEEQDTPSKQSVSEICMVKEFLLATKLHRAITFGMDVPSLLFADATGKECGEHGTEEDVLKHRLFDTPLLQECEQDYNRVLSHRICRAVLPRSEFSSPIVRTLITELVAGCVLTPIMSCFSPEYLNGWICSAIQAAETSATTQDGVVNWDTSESGVEVPLEIDEEEPSAAPVSVEAENRENTQEEAIEVVVDEFNLAEEDDAVVDQSSEEEEEEASSGVLMVDDDEQDESTEKVPGDYLLPLLTMSIIDLQRFISFDESRQKKSADSTNTNWDDAECQEAVRQVFLVIEAALVHGRRSNRLRVKKVGDSDDNKSNGDDDSDDEGSLLPFHPANLSQILMELTSDIDTFEARLVEKEKQLEQCNIEYVVDPGGSSAADLSTLRTLIAAWMHTGQVYRIISVFVKAKQSILVPFFHEHAFLRNDEHATGLVQQLRCLDAVGIMVDTTSILDSSSLDANGQANHRKSLTQPKSVTIKASTPESRRVSARGSMGALNMAKSLISSVSSEITFDTEGHDFDSTQTSPGAQAASSVFSPNQTPRYLDFHRNQNFASSLRAERERRLQSWLNVSASMADQGLSVVCRRKGTSEHEVELHRDLHRLARTFYSGTNIIALRDGTRRAETDTEPDLASEGKDGNEVQRVSLLTAEMTGTRRKIEIPDDDSSFLIRAQPRPLKAVSMHLDQRDHHQSYRTFSATYEEPAILPGSNRYAGGRYVRTCTMKYYPNDHTATIELPYESRQLDQRRAASAGPPATISIGQPRVKSLTGDFLRKRHLCQKWIPRGAAPRSGGSILASSVMEPSDFHSVPRAGKSIDFVYRMSLFECPMVELSGKRFTIHDSSVTGTHRADASSMELSDATLGYALSVAGRDWESASVESSENRPDSDARVDAATEQSPHQKVEMGPDGYPIVWMKLHRKQGEKTLTEIKPYRASYVRAALWVASTRHEAQRQCLLMCVRSGSARNATRARVDSLMIPTQRLLQFANSADREKQSILMRDLKLGINHIDREQLLRNKLLYPRRPTAIKQISAAIEGLMHVRDIGMDFAGASPSTVVYKIRCIAIVELINADEEDDELLEYDSGDSKTNVFREEWVVYRQYRDFNSFHKHLKTQVATTETSGTAGSRLVGAATAAFAVGGGTSTSGDRRRKILVPSLGQASKAGALGITKKAVQKRRAILHNYLQHILAPDHPMRQCTEILTFLGAYHAFPSEIRTGEAVSTRPDSLGRMYMSRSPYDDEEPDATNESERTEAVSVSERSLLTESPSKGESESLRTLSTTDLNADDDVLTKSARLKELDMDPALRSKIDQVPLGKVRTAIFELIRSQFDFEHASFFRNRLLGALKTVSFAIASNAQFRKTLYDTHKTYLNADAIADLIKTGLELLWPNGVLFESAPPLTPEESKELSERARTMLEKAFPDQIRSIVGADIAQDGVDTLHEMLQNRVIVRSLFYMFVDLLLLEIFPELQDVLTCGSVLET